MSHHLQSKDLGSGDRTELGEEAGPTCARGKGQGNQVGTEAVMSGRGHPTDHLVPWAVEGWRRPASGLGEMTLGSCSGSPEGRTGATHRSLGPQGVNPTTGLVVEASSRSVPCQRLGIGGWN